jgi:low temperature requirement protein LtrA
VVGRQPGFDLVFVFTVTQLGEALVHHFDVVGALRVMLMLVVIWWMYGGYAWLTNAVAPTSTTRRTLLLLGMAGFFVVALAAPAAFEHSGWAFGAGYFVVNLVHTGLFLLAGGRETARSVLRLAPLNLASATLVLAGGFGHGTAQYVLWAVAFAGQIVTPYLHRMDSYTVIPGHFVERHGLVVIIAIGESVIAIGMGFAGHAIDAGVIVVALLGLCVAYYLWWAYFSGADERTEHALSAVEDQARRNRLALAGWGYAHYPIVLGIVVLAVGVKKIVGHPFEAAPPGVSVALGVGAALFLFGHAWFLRLLHVRGVPARVGGGIGVLAVIPLGQVQAVVQLAATAVVMAVALIADDIWKIRLTHSTQVSSFGRTTS